jgi:hypothetical protein
MLQGYFLWIGFEQTRRRLQDKPLKIFPTSNTAMAEPNLEELKGALRNLMKYAFEAKNEPLSADIPETVKYLGFIYFTEALKTVQMWKKAASAGGEDAVCDYMAESSNFEKAWKNIYQRLNSPQEKLLSSVGGRGTRCSNFELEDAIVSFQEECLAAVRSPFGSDWQSKFKFLCLE